MRNIEITRDIEAPMSAVGYPPVVSNTATGEDRGTVTMASPQAPGRTSVKLSCALRQCFAGSMHLNTMSVDRLLKQTYAQGFEIEFTGRSGKDLY